MGLRPEATVRSNSRMKLIKRIVKPYILHYVDRAQLFLSIGRKEHLLAAHGALCPAIETKINCEKPVADQKHREMQIPRELALPAKQAIEEVAGIVVRVVLEVIDLVEDQHGPLGIALEALPDRLEHAIYFFDTNVLVAAVVTDEQRSTTAVRILNEIDDGYTLILNLTPFPP